MPGCEDAKLRNFGMTLGVRDTRKIDALYNLTEHDVREQARFDDSIGIFPEFIDGYGDPDPADDRPLLPAALPLARPRGRRATSSSPGAASAATRSRTPRCAA